MNATVKALLDAMKWPENGVKKTVWHEGQLYAQFFTGEVVRFDKRMATVGMRAHAEEHGWEARLGDKCAVNVKDFPNKADRSREAHRRMKEAADHYMSGANQWDLPRGPRETGPNEADMVEILNAISPGNGQVLLTKTLEAHKGDLKAAKLQWLGTKQGAKAWADIQAARRAVAAEGLDNADDMVAKILAAANELNKPPTGADAGVDDEGKEG